MRSDGVCGMIDFHTHILPGMDDGSKSVSESLEMLQLEARQGINLAVLTPHFYSSENSPDTFLRRRQRSWEKLSASLEDGLPRLLLGAEVQYFEGIAQMENIRLLCIWGTRLLLLEMPFCSWDERMVQTVLTLQENGEVQPVLAHIDRYLSFRGNSAQLDRLRRQGILMQMNVSAFNGFFSRRKAASMVRGGKLHFFGSDCHNNSTRKPNWELVPEDELWETMETTSNRLLRQHMIR